MSAVDFGVSLVNTVNYNYCKYEKNNTASLRISVEAAMIASVSANGGNNTFRIYGDASTTQGQRVINSNTLNYFVAKGGKPRSCLLRSCAWQNYVQSFTPDNAAEMSFQATDIWLLIDDNTKRENMRLAIQDYITKTGNNSLPTSPTCSTDKNLSNIVAAGWLMTILSTMSLVLWL